MEEIQRQENRALDRYEISPARLWGQLNPKNLEDIIISKRKGISGIVKDLGRDRGELYVKALLTEAIIDLSEFFNVQNNFSERQVVSTVNIIREKYYYFKPDDFKLCFKEAMKGTYGKVYNRLDGSLIMEWLESYETERVSFFEGKSDHQAYRDKEVRDLTVSSKDNEFHSIKVAHFKKQVNDSKGY